MKIRLHVRARTVGNALGLGAVVAASTATLWLVGMPAMRALALAVPIAAGAALVRTLSTNAVHDLAWPGPPSQGPACAGWHHVALTGSFLHEATCDAGRFKSIVAPRLRKLADERLREQHVRWDDPSARELLGRDVYDLLAWPPEAPPKMVAIREAISRIEALGARGNPASSTDSPTAAPTSLVRAGTSR